MPAWVFGEGLPPDTQDTCAPHRLKVLALVGQSRLGMEKNVQTQGISEESELIGNEEQRQAGTASTAD